MLSYKEQLQHPLWQKKRLEIMQRDNFTCRYCSSIENQLHVHHLIYLKNIHIWEYPDNLLLTLCNKCHSMESEDGYIASLGIGLITDLSLLCDMDIQQLQSYFEQIDFLIGNEGYSYKEAFKKLLLELISHS
jgi:hypothetical protein